MNYNANKYNTGVNVAVSVNKTVVDGVPIPGRTMKNAIATSWYFHASEEDRIRMAFEQNLPVTVTGMERGRQVATYLAESMSIIDISAENPTVGQPRRVEFKLVKRLFAGAPIWNGSLGMHAVAVRGLEDII